MNIVTAKEYEKEKVEFLHSHKDWNVITSPMDENGKYHKEYVCDNGDIWFEICKPYEDTVETEINRCKLNVDVTLFETEFWSTSDSVSKFYYEPF